MTSARRPVKAWFASILRTLGMLLTLATAASGPSSAAITERIITDLHTGLAISGYDPVAYFTDAAPIIGRPEFEFRFEGVVWRFDNEGNLAAFAEHSEQYIPQFGGYDAVAIARGVAVAGNPAFWDIVGDRLYLFYSAEALESFKADTDGAVAAADAKWPQVLEGLAP
jgi:hypothetical protein